MQTPTIIGHIGGEPVFELNTFPTIATNQGAYDSGAVGCPCGGGEQLLNLATLLNDVVDFTEDFVEVADRLHSQIQAIDQRGYVEPAEQMLNAAAHRARLLKELTIASQAVIQLRALVGTAAHVLS